MKSVLVFFCSLLITLNLVAQDDPYPFITNNGKCGYKDPKTNEIVIPAIYTTGKKFYNGSAKVQQGNYWGLINKEGKTIIPIKYKEISTYSSGLCIVANDKSKWGVLNKEGKIIIPVEYNDIIFKKGGLLFVVNDKKKRGVFNTEGKTIVPVEYNNIENNYKFPDLLVVANDKNKWGLIDVYGRMVIPNEFDTLCVNSKDLVLVKKNKLWGAFNIGTAHHDYDEKTTTVSLSELVIQIEYLELKSPLNLGKSRASDEIVQNLIYGVPKTATEDDLKLHRGPFWLFNNDGMKVYPEPLGTSPLFENGKAVVWEYGKDKEFLIDTDGKIVLKN